MIVWKILIMENSLESFFNETPFCKGPALVLIKKVFIEQKKLSAFYTKVPGPNLFLLLAAKLFWLFAKFFCTIPKPND